MARREEDELLFFPLRYFLLAPFKNARISKLFYPIFELMLYRMLYNDVKRKGANLVQTWLPGFSAFCRYTTFVMASANMGYPLPLREDVYKRLKYIVDEIIAKIKSGYASFPRRKIAEEVVNKISDPKIKQICLEINTTPDQNVLSLSQQRRRTETGICAESLTALYKSLGEAIKWTLWYRAQRISGAVQALGKNRELLNLLDKATSKNQPYYSDPSEKAAHRFLEDYKNNFYKTAYDMIRHDPTYIPTILVLNPAIDAFEHILKVIFYLTTLDTFPLAAYNGVSSLVKSYPPFSAKSHKVVPTIALIHGDHSRTGQTERLVEKSLYWRIQNSEMILFQQALCPVLEWSPYFSKRSMYGRANFDLLGLRVLHHRKCA